MSTRVWRHGRYRGQFLPQLSEDTGGLIINIGQAVVLFSPANDSRCSCASSFEWEVFPVRSYELASKKSL